MAVGGQARRKRQRANDVIERGTKVRLLALSGHPQVLGQIVTLLLPSVVAAAQSGNLSGSGIVSQAIA